MSFSRFAAFFVPAVCLLAQAPVPKPAAPVPSVAPVPPAPVSPDKVVMTVGDEKITAGEFSQLVASLPDAYRRMVQSGGKRQFAENIVRVRLLAQEARRNKLDQDPVLRTQMAFQRDTLLANSALQKLLATAKVDGPQAQKYYEQHKNDFERVHARHILIRMQGSPVPLKGGQKDLSDAEALAKAQEVRKRLLAGEDFATVAKTESDDAGSAANGGDLGFFKHGQMVPQFDQAAFQLETGKISEPVKSNYGYHVIKVEQKEIKTFDEVKPEIAKQMQPQMAESIIEGLRKQTAITLDDSYFGASPVIAPKPASPHTP